jgi:hypothetical protein
MAEPVTPPSDSQPETPSLKQFLAAAGPRNPHKTPVELAQYWNKEYGNVDPKTLPSLETFLPAAKEKNPTQSDYALAEYWKVHYGSLGAMARTKASAIVGGSPIPATRKDLTMGLLNTAEAPDPLILPEEPEDLLDMDPVENLERWLEAGVPLDVIDRRMDSFFGRASASIAPSTPRMLTPKARNNPPTNLTPPLNPSRPVNPKSLLEFVKANQPLNPHMTVPELAQVWNKDWGHVDPKTLPSKESFLAKNKPLNPDVPEADLAQHWDDHYGSLGAPEKNPSVTALSKMTGQATAARTRP